MHERRQIRGEERELIVFLLKRLGFSTNDYPINESVEEYEGGKMGSISMGDARVDEYAGDLIQVKYVDVDNIPVMITLTRDTNNKLLDLDFWKEDFSKLIRYPKPEDVIF